MEYKLDQHAIAASFGVTTRTLRNWVKTGELLKPHRIGRKQFWLKEELDAWLRDRSSQHSKPAAPASKSIVRRGRPRQPV